MVCPNQISVFKSTDEHDGTIYKSCFLAILVKKAKNRKHRQNRVTVPDIGHSAKLSASEEYKIVIHTHFGI